VTVVNWDDNKKADTLKRIGFFKIK